MNTFKRIGILICLFVTSLGYSESLELYLENDVAVPNNEDNSYSHGTRITYYSNGDFVDNSFIEKGFAVSQFMYTPNDISIEEIQYGQRPYAGVLYLSFLNRESTKQKRSTLELQVGAIGDQSYVEETQTKIHEWTESTIPMGWDNQIGNSPILNLSLKNNFKLLRFTYFDLIGGYGGSLGNLYIGANVDIAFRLGIIGSGYIPNMIEPTNLKKSELYFFSRLNQRVIGHNTTLDGRLFSDDVYTVDSEPFVTELEGGIHYENPSYYLQFSYIGRTDEFEGQNDQHTFGSIKIGNKW